MEAGQKASRDPRETFGPHDPDRRNAAAYALPAGAEAVVCADFDPAELARIRA